MRHHVLPLSFAMCFHIRWSINKIDWECHESPDNAIDRALEMIMPGETFKVEACGADGDALCPNQEKFDRK
jgi:hypothetical protein